MQTSSNNPDLSSLPWKRITRSPDEEWLARAAATGKPEAIGDQIVAVFLTTSRVVTIKPHGIRFQHRNEDLHFWQSDTLTLRDEFLGQHRTIRFDADDLSCVHIFDDAGRYVETIQRYVAPGALDPAAMETVRKAKARQLRGVLTELQELHRADSLQAKGRELRNADRVQRVRTFPQPTPIQSGPTPLEAGQVSRNQPQLHVGELQGNDSPRATERDSAAEYGTARVPLSTETEGHDRTRGFKVADRITQNQRTSRRRLTEEQQEESYRVIRERQRTARAADKLAALYE